MNKTLLSILTVALMSISFAACSQVDLVEESELGNKQDVTVNVPSEVSSGYLLVAHRVVGLRDTTLINSNTMSIMTGAYKFYAVSYGSSYSKYYNFDAVKTQNSSKYISEDVISYIGTYNPQSAFSPISKELTGDFYSPKAPVLYADSTKMVDIEKNGNSSISMLGAYQLTPTYSFTLSGSVPETTKKVYVVIKNVPTKTCIAGGPIFDNSGCSCVFELKMSTEGDSEGLYQGTMTLMGLPSSGTATVYTYEKGSDPVSLEYNYKVNGYNVTLYR